MKASVAVVTTTTTTTTTTATSTSSAAAAAAATCAAGAAIRPSPLLPSSAAHNHQKCRQREQVVAKVVPQHHFKSGAGELSS